VWLLRRDNCQTIGFGDRRAGPRGRGGSADASEARGDYSGGAGTICGMEARNIFSGPSWAVRALSPKTIIEVLTPDLMIEMNRLIRCSRRSRRSSSQLETVRRLTPAVRSRATYDRSLSVLQKVKAKRGDEIYTKSG